MADNGQMKIVEDAEFFDYVCTSQIDEETFHFLGLKFLHLLKIVRIQNDLIVTREHISRTRRENLEKEKLSKLLDEHSEASVCSSWHGQYSYFFPTTALRNYYYVHEARLSIMKPLNEGNNASSSSFPP
ncbi:hypothetical protein MANI_015638 [Metarhizium anisopliae]